MINDPTFCSVPSSRRISLALTLTLWNPFLPLTKKNDYNQPLFFLVYGDQIYTNNPASYFPLGTVLLVGLTSGLAYMVLTYNFWNISGGHLNPAVTWGAMITRRIGFFKGVGYILAQFAGAILGALLVHASTPDSYNLSMIGATWNNSFSDWNGFLLETMVTFVFVHTFFAAAFDPISMGRVAPISIGFALTVGYFLTWPAIGGTTNPARAFAVAVSTGDFQHQWVYLIAPLVGSTLASLTYLLLFMTRNVEGALGYHHHPDGVKLITEAPGAVTERTRLIPTGNAHV